MRLILVRHGEAAWPEGWVEADVGLTERGRRQAEAAGSELARRFATGAPGNVWSSPMRRARETAEALAQALGGAPVSVDAGLGGLADPELKRKLSEDAVDATLLAHVAGLQERAWAAVSRLVEQAAPDATVVVAGHDVTIAAVLCRALSMPVEHFRRWRIDLASLTVLDFRAQGRRLALLNETCHVEGLD